MTASNLTIAPLSLVHAWRRQFGLDHVSIGTLESPAVCHVVGKFLLDLRLAHQEEIHVVRREPRIEGRREPLTWYHRGDQPRRNKDNQISFLLLVRSAPEQRPEHRHRAKPRNLRHIAGI